MKIEGTVFKIQRHSLHDGTGIRTLVFLKGCPLRCVWCFNPESQSADRELFHHEEKCIGCGACVKVCPSPDVVSILNGKAVYHAAACSNCGACVEVCPAAAFQDLGTVVTPEDVAEVVARDKVFYDKSGGGVTLSGGEVTLQSEFAAAVLEQCKSRGIHTAIETCGYCSWEKLGRILAWTDLVLFDLKVMNAEKHRRLTGVDNALILENLKRTVEAGKNLLVRMPIIPGFNDSLEDAEEAAAFLSVIKGLKEIHLLPYEMFGIPKYERLGRTYELHHLTPPSDEKMVELRNYYLSKGLAVKLGG